MRAKNTRYPLVFLLLVLGFVLNSNSFADQALYDKHCGVCHTLDPDQPQRQGPYLGNIIGRDAGAVAGFPYSTGLKNLGLTWDAETLDRWIAAPQQLASDSYMMYQQGDADIRAEIVSFLSAFSPK